MQGLYWSGFLMRIADPDSQQNKVNTKAVHAILAIVLWSRLLRYYAVHNVLGPKLIMMTRMLKDVAIFIFLLLVFLFGYGVAAQSLLFPLRDFDYQSAENVIFRPYFQIYGELFLEDLQQESDCVGPWPFSACGWKVSWLVPVLLAGYVLVTNILLINLLIAQFNDTYIKVQDNSQRLWNKQNFGKLGKAVR